jgi:hypothetical protein
MAPTSVLPWLFAAILAIVHYWGEEIAAHPHTPRVVGLSAGVTVSYVFLDLLPRFHTGIDYLGQIGFFAVLAGFVALAGAIAVWLSLR